MSSVFQDDVIAFADDYVMGLMSPTEAELFEALIAADPALAAHVARLREQLLPLDLSAEALALPPGFAARLQDIIARTPQDAAPTTPLSADPTVAPVAARTWRRVSPSHLIVMSRSP